jgi:outer membrane protein assembly factor BamB
VAIVTADDAEAIIDALAESGRWLITVPCFSSPDRAAPDDSTRAAADGREDELRRRYGEPGRWADRVRVICIDTLDDLPPRCANLFVGGPDTPTAAALRLLADHRAMALVRHAEQDEAHGTEGGGQRAERRAARCIVDSVMIDNRPWLRFRRPGQADADATAGLGVWTHQYATAANTAYGGETLGGREPRRPTALSRETSTNTAAVRPTVSAPGGCDRTDQLRAAWFGLPGPRHQSDRQTRKPTPLAIGGRLFVQGLERITALDAANGSLLWHVGIPDFRRFNMRCDSANWCADARQLYLAVRGQCWALDVADGRLARRWPLPESAIEPDRRAWGYVGNVGGTLVGTTVDRDAPYREFWGGQFWYDNQAGPLTAKVCGANLFAYDCAPAEADDATRAEADDATRAEADESRRMSACTHAPRLLWNYRGGPIVHTSITLIADTVYLVEGRSEHARRQVGRRLGAELWEDPWLVALDRRTGRLRSEKPLECDPGVTMFSMAAADHLLVVVSSGGAHYDLRVFRQEDAALLWNTRFPWAGDGKGAHSARPIIVADRLYLPPDTFDLWTGEKLPVRAGRGACGTCAATRGALVSRIGNLSLWSAATETTTGWTRLRPDCWLSTIPAGGMILSPEAGGGCSCGGWLETSIGFTPRSPRAMNDESKEAL